MANQPPQPDPWLLAAFEAAQAAFNSQFSAAERIDFSQYQSIEDIYDTTDAIQTRQSKSTMLRSLDRIKPYLECLAQFQGVIEVFVSTKPDLLALIWAPIRLALESASRLVKAFELLVDVLGKIGLNLPHFQQYTQLFRSNDKIQKILCLFYQDILDFHVTFLKFFRKPKWELFFESLWPKTSRKVDLILQKINQHKMMMTSEVTLENISQEVAARQRDYIEFERIQEHQALQNFRSLLTELAPCLYDKELRAISRNLAAGSGEWLAQRTEYVTWANTNNKSHRCLWIHGIPGAGKTFLSGRIIQEIQQGGQRTLFAFMTYRDEEQSSTIKLLQSLIFQLLVENKTLQPILHEAYLSHYRQLVGDEKFLTQLLLNLLEDSGVTFIVIDGLDEVDEDERDIMMKALLDILSYCEGVKMLISSRSEHTISRGIGRTAAALRIDRHNAGDIAAYVNAARSKVIEKLRGWGADDRICSNIAVAMNQIKARAGGMFLYAELMVRIIEALDNPDDIEKEMQDLPHGLEQAYDRILARIEENPIAKEREAARNILQWVACARRPLSQEEILQALVVSAGAPKFASSRKVFRDLQQSCGPIIEITEDRVSFVHFTAKEYLFKGKQRIIEENDGNLNLGSVCTTYLAFENNDVLCNEAPVLDIKQHIVSGEFVLFEYASREWLSHIKLGTQTRKAPEVEDLSAQLERLFDRRSDNSKTTSLSAHLPKAEFRSFRRHPELVKRLAEAEKFNRAFSSGALEENEKEWFLEDPTQISAALARLRMELEKSVCDSSRHDSNCCCIKVKQLYGDGIFKCPNTTCAHFDKGFTTRAARDEHVTAHSRPHKCADLTCLFSKLGFRTAYDLLRHEATLHRGHATLQLENLPRSGSSNLAIRDQKAVLEDAIAQDQVDVVDDILTSCTGKDGLYPEDMVEVFYKALKTGSAAIIEAFLRARQVARNGPKRYRWPVDWDVALGEAIGSENVSGVELLMTEGRVSIDCEVPVPATYNTNFGAWEDVYEDNLLPFELAFGMANASIMEILLRNGAANSIRTSNFEAVFTMANQRRLLTKDDVETRTRLKALKRFHLSAQVYQFALFLAVRGGAVHYARFCLDMGADADGMMKKHKQGRPLIWIAARSGNADMVRLLLQNGADVEVAAECEDLAGVRKIEQHFDKTWEDIVAQYGIAKNNG